MEMMRLAPVALSLLATAALVSCDVAPPASPQASPTSNAQPASNMTGGSNLRQRQADFLNRIRAADPQQTTIDRALLNEQNELGLILDRRVEMDKVPDLMRTMLTQMAREFPNEDLTVLAYAPSEPPRKIGTAHLDARTRDMTYTAEH